MAHIIRIGFYIQGLDDCFRFLFSPHYWTGFFTNYTFLRDFIIHHKVKLQEDDVLRDLKIYFTYQHYLLDRIYFRNLILDFDVLGSYVQRLAASHPPANSSRHLVGCWQGSSSVPLMDRRFLCLTGIGLLFWEIDILLLTAVVIWMCARPVSRSVTHASRSSCWTFVPSLHVWLAAHGQGCHEQQHIPHAGRAGPSLGHHWLVDV